VSQGEVVTVLGPNGAGKTTLLNTIAGILRSTSGSCLFRGEEMCGCPSHKIVSKKISMVPEGGRVFPLLTVSENLALGALRAGKGLSQEESLEQVFGLFPVLKERRKQLGGTLSGGEQQMLAIGRALMSRPELILLDEPSSGLSPALVVTVFEILEEINRRGTTVLLVEQNIAYSLMLANRAYVLVNGRITLENEAKVLRDNPEIKRYYLGL
jgi:branched-chain amino acid transport system ATP-binding protein